jgi:putative transposase
MKFGFVDEHRHIWPVRLMCTVLGLSVSGYYAWRSRVESPRAAANRVLLEDIRRIHRESSGTLARRGYTPCCATAAAELVVPGSTG